MSTWLRCRLDWRTLSDRWTNWLINYLLGFSLLAKRLAEKSILIMTYLMSSRTLKLNSVNRSVTSLLLASYITSILEVRRGPTFLMEKCADELTSCHSHTSFVPLVVSSLATSHLLIHPRTTVGTQVQCGPLTERLESQIRSGRPRQTWLHKVESDVAPLNAGLTTAYHRPQNWQAWKVLVGIATSIVKPHDDDADGELVNVQYTLLLRLWMLISFLFQFLLFNLC